RKMENKLKRCFIKQFSNHKLRKIEGSAGDNIREAIDITIFTEILNILRDLKGSQKPQLLDGIEITDFKCSSLIRARPKSGTTFDRLIIPSPHKQDIGTNIAKNPLMMNMEGSTAIYQNFSILQEHAGLEAIQE
ncbi:hypothetical protein ACJX0J_021079, partial [Zea mays]